MPVRYAVPPPDATPPPGFVEHTFARDFEVALPRAAVWDWLNDPATFIRGQPWPYFVEFVDGGFETGVLNTHTGPLIHFPGVIGEVRAPEYRDLSYLYGAYVFRMRWIRPVRLQFWVDEIDVDGNTGTRVHVRVDSHVRSWIRGIWSTGNSFFWRFFGRTIQKGVRRRLAQAA